MKTKIALKYANAVVVSPLDPTSDNFKFSTVNETAVASLATEMMALGFIPSKDLYAALKNSTHEQVYDLFDEGIPVLKKMKGANVKYTPMYPNFPQQVMSADDAELFINALIHYWSFGQLLPEYETDERPFAFENTKFKEIGLINDEEFRDIFTQLISSNDSISETDKKTLEWFIKNVNNLTYPSDIPFKENLCLVAGILLKEEKDVTDLVSTTTDVLRIITYLSDGDISLAENTKFKNLSRPIRRMFTLLLEDVISAEDINRHRNKWNKLFHNLHVGDYSSKVYNIASKIRNNKKIETFNSSVQNAFDCKDWNRAVALLTTRPGEFARKIDFMVRSMPTNKQSSVIMSFLLVLDKVSTRILLQLRGNLKIRNKEIEKRVVFPKGNGQRAVIVHKKLERLSTQTISLLTDGIENTLYTRFAKLEPLKDVWIDPELVHCPIPTAQRSASEGLFQVARGTRLSLGDKGTLRFFIYWKGEDLDLSATLHDENFNMIEQISYTNLRSSKYKAVHSGDIVDAPNGASEFIDIDIDSAVKFKARYVVMNVFVYSGPTFAEHEICYAGWMTRSKPDSNEIYEPKTVEQKIDIRSNSKNVVPVIFDLVERKMIWVDLTTKIDTHHWGNNVHSNKTTISETLEAMVSLDNKMTLHDLFTLHASSRGIIVNNKEEADTIFSIADGITPFDVTLINSEYIK